MNPTEFVTVATYTTGFEAHLAKGRLLAEGIDAMVVDDQHISADWAVSQAIGGSKVRVMRQDLAKAESIIGSHDTGEYALNDAQEACPECGSDDLVRKDFWQRFSLLAFFLGGIPLPWSTGMSCKQCGHSWKDT